MADFCLQFQRDVLDDVRGVRAAPQSGDEAASLADGALVLDEAGERPDQRLGEIRHVGAVDLVIRTYRQVKPGDRASGPKVGTAQAAQRNQSDFSRRVGVWHRATGLTG